MDELVIPLLLIGSAIIIQGLWKSHSKILAGIIAIVVLLLLLFLVLPGFVTSRPFPARNALLNKYACFNNLGQIKIAKEKWAADHAKKIGDIPIDSDLFGANAYVKFKPSCPDGGVITIGAVGQNPTCSLADKGHKL